MYHLKTYRSYVSLGMSGGIVLCSPPRQVTCVEKQAQFDGQDTDLLTLIV